MKWLTPKKEAIAVAAADVAVFVIELLPFVPIHDLLNSQMPSKGISIIRIYITIVPFGELFNELQLMLDFIRVESKLLYLIYLSLKP
jgi:hypothetical protein